MVRKSERPQHIIHCALELAVARGWSALSLREIADASGLKLAELHAVYPAKSDILAAFLQQVDAQVLAAETPFTAQDSARDRLFDVLMRRFDALSDHRDAVARIVRDIKCDPVLALETVPALRRSGKLMLEAANISTRGFVGVLRVKGLAAVWLATLRVWEKDDSPDLAKTMAALDKNLRRAETLERFIPNTGHRKHPKDETGAAAEPV